MIELNHKQHKKSMQIFIDLYKSNKSRFIMKDKYLIEDDLTKRKYWVCNGPVFFRLYDTKNGVQVDSNAYWFWYLSWTHIKAWRYAKQILREYEESIKNSNLAIEL